MTKYKLIIETHGICTHFRYGVVSGVPHRVVLPNTTDILGGRVALADQPSLVPARYYLVPHFPQIELVERPRLTISGLLREGDIVMGARLQVLNCVERGVTYADPPGGPNLTTYYPDYTPSDDVVLNGRASCYFDIYGGTVSYVQRRQTGPGHMKIEMHTYGPPELLVTPLAESSSRSGPAPAYGMTIPVPDHPDLPITLKLRNLELARELPAEDQRGAFDFLLHYLTARGGIPATIAQPTPGMPATPSSITTGQMAVALGELALELARANEAAMMMSPLPLMMEAFVTASCAPSEYP